jgi:hypothetical protein
MDLRPGLSMVVKRKIYIPKGIKSHSLQTLVIILTEQPQLILFVLLPEKLSFMLEYKTHLSCLVLWSRKENMVIARLNNLLCSFMTSKKSRLMNGKMFEFIH